MSSFASAVQRSVNKMTLIFYDFMNLLSMFLTDGNHFTHCSLDKN